MRCVGLDGGSAVRYFVAASMLAASSAVGQPPADVPFALPDPSQVLEDLFGSETPADRASLAAIEISAKEEKQHGDAAASAFLNELRRRKISVISRGREVQYVRRLVASVHPLMTNHSRYDNIRVYLALSQQTDARSFPGGALVFFRGLLDDVESEAALVAVIGHELSHLDRGHQLRHLRQMKLARQALHGTESPPRFVANGLTLMRLFARPFRPEDEAEADRDGAKWAYDLGYDPRELGRLFQRWHERDRGRAGLPGFLQTHPRHIDRHIAILQLAADLQAAAPEKSLYIGKINLRLRVPRQQTEFHE